MVGENSLKNFSRNEKFEHFFLDFIRAKFMEKYGITFFLTPCLNFFLMIAENSQRKCFECVRVGTTVGTLGQVSEV